MRSRLANVLDLEFDGDEIIEIGLTIIDLSRKSLLKTYSIPIQPGLSWISKDLSKDRVSDEIHELTGWTYGKLMKQGIPFKDACDRISNRYGGKGRLLITDTDNEAVVFENHCFVNWFDVDHYFYPFGDDVLNVSTLFKIKTGIFDNLSLENMLGWYGLSFEGKQHRADSDSRNIARLFLEITK